MHVCLSIPEILAIICSKFAPSSDLTGEHEHDLAALAVLARTSRIFYDPALNALWNGLGTIFPLLRCMPSDLWEEKDVCGEIVLVSLVNITIAHSRPHFFLLVLDSQKAHRIY
jgi:hypothetical protein